MAKFCGNCGYPLNEAFGFCGNCGANQRANAQPVQPAAASNPAAGTGLAAGAPPKSSGVLKVVLVLVAVLFVGGALAVAGLFYAAHKVSQKAREYSAKVLSDEPERRTGGFSSSKSDEDVCRLLNKDDVSEAIGMTVVATSSSGSACAYLVRATSTDLAAKHMASMAKTHGADAKAQGQIEQLTGGFLGALEAQAKEATQDANGNAVVLSVSVDSNSAAAQMKLNRRVLGGLSPDTAGLKGIGDEAFDTAGSMMMIRKGDKLIRIMYMSCPCTAEAIKPLAQKLVNAL